MAGPKSEPPFAAWQAPPISREIQYPPALIEEIRATACAALSESPAGDVEVGGVLFGTNQEASIRISAWRPIICRHILGPGFRLSAPDRMELACELELARRTGELASLQPVGWFVSHPKSAISLSRADLEIYSGFFPYDWQVTLVVQPAADGHARAGFFAREPDGSLKSDSSYHEFELQPPPRPAPAEDVPLFAWAQARKSAARTEPDESDAREKEVREHVAILAAHSSPPEAIAPSFARSLRLHPRSRWLWSIPIILAAAAAGVLIPMRSPPSARFEPFPLRVSNAGQTIEIEWDSNSALIRAARRAVLDINDGGKPTQYSLSADQVHAGSMSYVRSSGEVDLRMTVYPEGGPAVEGFGRLVAPPSGAGAAKPAEPGQAESSRQIQELRQQRDALAGQVKELQVEIQKQTAERKRLQELVRILEGRLNILPNRSPAGEPSQTNR